MIDKTLINQELLDQEILSLEKGYVETVVNLVKGPIFIESCNEAIKNAEGDQKEALEKTLFLHLKNQKTNEEAIEQLNTILVKVKEFKI